MSLVVLDQVKSQRVAIWNRYDAGLRDWADKKESQIACVFHYQPLHIPPVGQRFGGYFGQCPVAEHAGDCLVRLPLYNTLTESDQARMIKTATNFAFVQLLYWA